jgi:hypothetical protein
MNLKNRLAKLEALLGSGPAPERCPKCQGTDLTEPGDEQARTAEEWPTAEVLRVYQEIAQRASRLAWCQTCRRLVPVGKQDPDWRRQFWEGCEGPELQRNMAHLIFLRAVYSARMSWRARAEAPEHAGVTGDAVDEAD